MEALKDTLDTQPTVSQKDMSVMCSMYFRETINLLPASLQTAAISQDKLYENNQWL